jgi:serine/threonine protein phosphatase PrpC
MLYAARTHPGLKHQSNQDALLLHGRVHQRPWRGHGRLDRSVPLLVAVADGVSTSPAPAVASRMVLTALRQAFERDPHRPVRHYVRLVHERLCAAATRAQRGMSSTLVGVIVRGDRAVVFNAGDSRAYQLAPGQARRLTRDHTTLRRMLDRGEITEAEAANAASCYSSLDSCFVADPFEDQPETFVREMPWEPGTSLLLCSDGLSGVVDDGKIAAAGGSPEARLDLLFQLALDHGSRDDISLVLLTRET